MFEHMFLAIEIDLWFRLVYMLGGVKDFTGDNFKLLRAIYENWLEVEKFKCKMSTSKPNQEKFFVETFVWTLEMRHWKWKDFLKC